jgi:hypothetical protein
VGTETSYKLIEIVQERDDGGVERRDLTGVFGFLLEK